MCAFASITTIAVTTETVAALLLGQRVERRRTLRNRRAVDVEDERDEAVISREADELEHGRLAEARDRGSEGRIADVALVQKLGAQVVDQRLVVREPRRTLFLRDRFGDARVEPRLHGVLAMRVPLVLRRPEARHHQDRELAQGRRQRGFEPHIVAEHAHAVGELGDSQQRRKRAAHAAAHAGGERLRDALLRRAHLLGRDRLETRSGHVSCLCTVGDAFNPGHIKERSCRFRKQPMHARRRERSGNRRSDAANYWLAAPRQDGSWSVGGSEAGDSENPHETSVLPARPIKSTVQIDRSRCMRTKPNWTMAEETPSTPYDLTGLFISLVVWSCEAPDVAAVSGGSSLSSFVPPLPATSWMGRVNFSGRKTSNKWVSPDSTSRAVRWSASLSNLARIPSNADLA